MAMAITVNDIKKMPLKAKIGAVAVVLFLIAYFYWFLFLSSAMAKKSSLSQKLTTMEEQIKEKSKVASQLSKYKAEVAALQENYKIALQKLPDQREIPSLFHSVAMAGKEAGIEFLLFEPKASVPGPPAEAKATKTSDLLKPSDQRLAEKENKAVKGTDDKKAGGKKEPEPEPFYEEIPVEVSVLGSFQNTLYFFDKVAKLPRIVNISAITMGEQKEARGGRSAKTETSAKENAIVSSCIIKTYMFIDKSEKTVQQPGEQSSKNKK